MLAGDSPVTIGARTADPYLHLDNRGLVVSDGRHGVLFPANTLPWVAETIGLIIEERRATRRQGEHILGGFLEADEQSAVLYAGPPTNLVSVVVARDAIDGLRAQITRR
jgi:hypothetical protein